MKLTKQQSKKHVDGDPHLLDSDKALTLILAGNALITIKDLEHQERFTFKVTKGKGRMFPNPENPKQELPDPNDLRNYKRFCKALCGPDNYSNYKYFAHITVTGGVEFMHDDKHSFIYKRGGDKAQISHESSTVSMFEFVLAHLRRGTLPKHIEIWHHGKCCRCGRTLTDDESIRLGLGPWCKHIIQKQKISVI